MFPGSPQMLTLSPSNGLGGAQCSQYRLFFQVTHSKHTQKQKHTQNNNNNKKQKQGGVHSFSSFFLPPRVAVPVPRTMGSPIASMMAFTLLLMIFTSSEER